MLVVVIISFWWFVFCLSFVICSSSSSLLDLCFGASGERTLENKQQLSAAATYKMGTARDLITLKGSAAIVGEFLCTTLNLSPSFTFSCIPSASAAAATAFLSSLSC